MFDEDDSNEQAVHRFNGSLSDTSPSAVERQICTVTKESSLDELCAAIDAADWLLSRAKSIHQLSRQIAINWIEQNGEFDVGDTHYSVGYNVVTRCRNSKECGIQLLKRLDGSFDRFLEVLVAQPFKSGSAKRILDQRSFRNLFIAKAASRIVAGVPERILKRGDKRFLGQNV